MEQFYINEIIYYIEYHKNFITCIILLLFLLLIIGSKIKEKFYINKKVIQIENKSNIIGIQGPVTADGDIFLKIIKCKNEASQKEYINYNIPSVVESFAGRDTELNEIKNFFENNFTDRIYVISGLPGYGKSTLAAKFAWTNEESFEKNLIWIKEIVLKKIITESNYEKYDPELWNDLLELLQSIPLTIQIVGALVRNEIKNHEDVCDKFNLEEYIRSLTDEKVEFLEESLPENTIKSYDKTIYNAILQTINCIKKDKSNTSDSVLHVMYIISYLNPDFIPVSLINAYISHHEIQLNLNNIIIILNRYSVISVNVFGTIRYISIHRLIQKTLQQYQKNNKINKLYYKEILKAICWIRKDFSLSFYFINYPIDKYLDKNVDVCIEHILDSDNSAVTFFYEICRKKSHKIIEIIIKDINPQILKRIVSKSNVMNIYFIETSKTSFFVLDYFKMEFRDDVYIFKYLHWIKFITGVTDMYKFLINNSSDLNSADEIKQTQYVNVCKEFLDKFDEQINKYKMKTENNVKWELKNCYNYTKFNVEEDVVNLFLYNNKTCKLHMTVTNFFKDIKIKYLRKSGKFNMDCVKNKNSIVMHIVDNYK